MSRSDYPDAGAGSPRSFKIAVTQYLMLPQEIQDAIPMIVWLIPAGTPSIKMPNALADYTDITPIPGQQCDSCAAWYIHGVSGGNLCSWLEEGILPEGWCKFWHQDPEAFLTALWDYIESL